MKSLLLRLAVVTVLALPVAFVAGPAMAAEREHEPATVAIHWQEGHEDEEAADEGTLISTGPENDVRTVTIWALVGTVIGGLVLSIFYLLKRRVGGFPAHPAWVAPISIMQSKDFPDEGYYGDAPADAHGTHH
jgi:hypothetical protein